MVAMDVVDTLRHRQELVDRELNADDRRQRLIEKLRDIYQAQGITVNEATLAEGVKALEEERFSYQAPAASFSVWLATCYVHRQRWLKPLLLLIGALFIFWILRLFLVDYPKWQLAETLPTDIGQTFSAIQTTAKDPQVIRDAEEQINTAAQALNAGEIKQAQAILTEMQTTLSTLQQQYQLRIVSRPNEFSGVWRIPDANSSARNYYIIVEAIDRNGRLVEVPVMSEEDNQIKITATWGVRVDQNVFQQIAADKQDDGIIQNNIIGEKNIGTIKPDYLIETNGAAITAW